MYVFFVGFRFYDTLYISVTVYLCPTFLWSAEDKKKLNFYIISIVFKI